MDPRSLSERAPSRLRMAAFAAVVLVLFLAGANALVECLEARGAVSTETPVSRVSVLGERAWERSGDQWRTSAHARSTMVDTAFPVQKGERVRIFLTGGSFAQGAPYTYPDQPEEGFGGMASWLREQFAEHQPPVEVINAAAGGQDARRAAAIVAEAVQLDADAVLVATCNNEGAVTPDAVREHLHQLGGYRLLARALTPDEAPEATAGWAPLPVEQAREFDAAYSESLQRMVDATAEAGVPLFLATVPLQLRHGGHEVGSGPLWVPQQLSGDPDTDACIEEGRRLLADGAPKQAVEHLADCGAHPAARETLEAAWMELWREGLSMDGGPSPGPCVADLLSLWRDGRYEELVAASGGCGEAVEALFWRGLALAELDRTDDAIAALEQFAELHPQGRCRPGLNRIARRLAAENDHVVLVDLDAVARAVSPRGIPGPELFASNCHLRWPGYLVMAEALGDALVEEGLLSQSGRQLPEVEDLEGAAEDRGLGLDPWWRDLIRAGR